jgi:hypothetical protein
VELTYFDREIVSWGRGLKYRANLENARSVLRFHCPSALCIGGDFDLSGALAGAVGVRQTKRAGHLYCKGTRRQPTGESVQCQAALHYKLTLAYRTAGMSKDVYLPASRKSGASRFNSAASWSASSCPKGMLPVPTFPLIKHFHWMI